MYILSSAYLGNIQYYCKLLQPNEPVTIDLGEHYRKQSLRNRCEIMGANGVIPLTIPVYKTSGEKTAMKEVKIDYTKAWQHQHWNSIRSAYKNSPYFDYYAEEFEPLYKKEREFLWEFNRELQQTILDILGVSTPVSYSDSYITESENDTDWRDSLSLKPRLQKTDDDFNPAPYYQVFSDKLPFAPNLSILDLLFCEGPNTTEIIGESGPKLRSGF